MRSMHTLTYTNVTFFVLNYEYSTHSNNKTTLSEMCVSMFQCESYRHILPLVHASYVPAQRLHPFEGFATVVAHKVFPLGVNGLVSVQSAGGDESLSADFTSVRPLSGVCPDVS